jgi:hypothetical protein
MASTVGQVPRPVDEKPEGGGTTPTTTLVREILLALGIVGPLFYLATDVFVGTRWEGYSFAGQAVSELFAIGAPTRPLAVLFFVAYGVLAIAFGAGVWASAGRKRALRVVGGALVGKEVFGIVATVFAPMHMRGAEATLSDTWHGNLTIVGVLCYLLAMGFGATAFGKRFRLYSIGTVLLLVVGGILAGTQFDRIPANLPTPWMGAWERFNIYATMLWISVLAISLLRAKAELPQAPSVGGANPDRPPSGARA